MKCVKLQSSEGISGLAYTDIDPPKTMTKNDLFIKHTSAGVDFDDIQFSYGREGAYYAGSTVKNRGIIGLSGTGIVEMAGSAIDGYFPVGTRVAYGFGSVGSFCEKRVINSSFVVKIPDGITDNQCSSIFRKGLLVHSLLFKVIIIRKGQTILVHNASGTTEQMLCRWASQLGINVVGIVSSKEHEQIARNSGCSFVLTYQPNWSEVVVAFTQDKGISIVFDSMGKTVFDESLKCLKVFGSYISYGSKEGEIKTIDVAKLAEKCLFFTAPVLEQYKATTADLRLGSEALFKAFKDKTIVTNFEAYKMSDMSAVLSKFERGGFINNVVLVQDQ